MAKLNNDQLAIMSAILGISNAGMDSVFKGSHALVKPEHVMDYYTSPRARITTHNAVYHFGSSFFESESMAETFVEEAEAWVKTLKNKATTTIVKTWPNYQPFMEAIGAA